MDWVIFYGFTDGCCYLQSLIVAKSLIWTQKLPVDSFLQTWTNDLLYEETLFYSTISSTCPIVCGIADNINDILCQMKKTMTIKAIIIANSSRFSVLDILPRPWWHSNPTKRFLIHTIDNCSGRLYLYIKSSTKRVYSVIVRPCIMIQLTWRLVKRQINDALWISWQGRFQQSRFSLFVYLVDKGYTTRFIFLCFASNTNIFYRLVFICTVMKTQFKQSSG